MGKEGNPRRPTSEQYTSPKGQLKLEIVSHEHIIRKGHLADRTNKHFQILYYSHHCSRLWFMPINFMAFERNHDAFQNFCYSKVETDLASELCVCTETDSGTEPAFKRLLNHCFLEQIPSSCHLKSMHWEQRWWQNLSWDQCPAPFPPEARGTRAEVEEEMGWKRKESSSCESRLINIETVKDHPSLNAEFALLSRWKESPTRWVSKEWRARWTLAPVLEFLVKGQSKRPEPRGDCIIDCNMKDGIVEYVLQTISRIPAWQRFNQAKAIRNLTVLILQLHVNLFLVFFQRSAQEIR